MGLQPQKLAPYQAQKRHCQTAQKTPSSQDIHDINIARSVQDNEPNQPPAGPKDLNNKTRGNPVMSIW